MFKNKEKIIFLFFFVSFFGIHSLWGMEAIDTDFNPSPRAWYRIVNKEKFFENKAFKFDKLRERENELKEMFYHPSGKLKGPFLDANITHTHPNNPIYCTYLANSPFTQWRFERTEDGYYKIINRFHENNASPKILNKVGENRVKLVGGEIGNKIKWTIMSSDEDNDGITPKLYTIINEDGESLCVASNGYVELAYLNENGNNDKFKWVFFKEK